jgi:hypothetical protein
VNRFGVVPDDVRSIDFTLKNGGRETATVTDNFYVAPPEAVKGAFTLDGVTQTQEFVPRSAVPAIGEAVVDANGATTRVEADGTISLAGPGVTPPGR